MSSRTPSRLLLAGAFLFWLVGPFTDNPSRAVEIPSKVIIRTKAACPGEIPILAPLKESVGPGVYPGWLVTPGGKEKFPAVVFNDEGSAFLAAVLKNLPAHSELVFDLEQDTRNMPDPGVEFREKGSEVEILIRGGPFSVHHTDGAEKPYLFPLLGPTGASYTRAFPMKADVAGEDHDHNHQRSFWFTHGSVNGIDFWASDPLNKKKANDGSIKETSRKILATGAVGILKTTDDWLDPTRKTILKDVRVMRVYDTSAARVLDIDVTLTAAGQPVTLGDTKEGMFGLRVASSMDVKNKMGGKITNAEGITDDAAWGKASPWVDYTGPVDGKTVGVAILNHPDSFRYPTTWHVRTYGLFAANPFGWHDFGLNKSGAYTLPAGKSLRFAYRVILHEGDTASAHIADAFKSYVEPPTVEVKSR